MITYNFNRKTLSESALFAVIAAVTAVSLLFITYFVAEPSISRAQSDTSTFIIQQTIVDETSFTVPAANVSMSNTINGVTGGSALGTTSFQVTTNNAGGYRVTIDFFDNTTNEAMIGDDTANEGIRDYQWDTIMTPTWGFTASSAAQFAYTVTSDNAGDTAQAFLNNTSACGAGSNQNGTLPSAKCWMTPSTTEYEIVRRTSSATAGATSTLEFYVVVPSDPDVVPTAEGYTATATLSLYTL